MQEINSESRQNQPVEEQSEDTSQIQPKVSSKGNNSNMLPFIVGGIILVLAIVSSIWFFSQDSEDSKNVETETEANNSIDEIESELTDIEDGDFEDFDEEELFEESVEQTNKPEATLTPETEEEVDQLEDDLNVLLGEIESFDLDDDFGDFDESEL